MSRRILVFGGAHVDRRGRIAGETVSGASNPGSFFEEAGGGGFNAARNLARLGHSVTMVSPRGGDPAGELVAEAAAQAGVIDRPFVFLDRKTPSYTAILERDGNLVIALADMDLYRLFVPRRLSIRSLRDSFAVSDAVLIDANLPQDTLTAIGRNAQSLGKPLAAIGVSPAKVIRLKPALPSLGWLFMNEAEARALVEEDVFEAADWPARLRALGLKGGVVTRGQREFVAFDEEGAVAVRPAALDEVADVTGAGDALAAGFLAARLAGLPLAEAARQGAAAAAITVLSPFAVSQDLSAETMEHALALVSEARILH